MKKLILWDLDGTLIDTLEDLGAAVDYALRLRGLPLPGTAAYRNMVGHGVRNLVQQALTAAMKIHAGANDTIAPDEASIDAALADFKAYYSDHIDVYTRPYDGIPELLAELQAHGIQMAVTSNKFQEGTEYLVKALFPDIDFVAILGNRPGLPLKPSPAIVEEVLEKAALAPRDAILVGDSPTDMRTAANGGIDAIAVSWGYRSKEELAAQRIVENVGQLKQVLMTLI